MKNKNETLSAIRKKDPILKYLKMSINKTNKIAFEFIYLFIDKYKYI